MTSETGVVRVARVVPETDAEGPGRRFAVWVQGCSIRCPSCFNPHMWSVRGGTAIPAGALADLAVSADVEGITLLGGEPFEQADSLADLAALAHAQGLSVMTFTGYTLESLRERVADGDTGSHRLLDATDLLVDGPYRADQPDTSRPWVGSTNQGFHFLSPRYQHLQAQLHTLQDRIEVRIARDGTVSVNGWATSEDLDVLLSDLYAGVRRSKP